MTAMIGEYFGAKEVTVVWSNNDETRGRILAHDEIGVVINTVHGHIMFVPYAAMDCMSIGLSDVKERERDGLADED